MTIIETSLQKEPNLQVFRLDPACPHTPDRMRHLHPTVIIAESLYAENGPLPDCVKACSTGDSSQRLHLFMREYTENQANQARLIYFERTSNFQTILLNQQHYAIDSIQDLITVVLGIYLSHHKGTLYACSENS